MSIPFIFRILLICLLWVGSWGTASATHAQGGDLDYSYIPGSASQYRITARLYSQDPLGTGGIPDPTSLYLEYSLNSCDNSTAGSFTQVVPRLRFITQSRGCVTAARTYRISYYETVVTLQPGQWTIKAIEENRSAGALNTAFTGASSLHITAFLDNSNGLVNNSPRFTAVFAPYASGSQPHRYSFSTFEPDGDSLVYRPVSSQSGFVSQAACGQAIPYATYPAGQFPDPATGQPVAYPAGQFTASFPFLSFQATNGVAVPQYNLNPANGDLQTTPVPQAGHNLVAVRVDEYRRLNGAWTRIGYVTRDITYTIFPAGTNRNPFFTTLQVAGAAPQPISQPVAVQRGQSVSVTLTATDPDAGQTLQFTSDVPAVVPGTTFQAQGSNQAVLTWQVPATLPPGRYTLTATATDNNCAISGSEVATIIFQVSAQALGTAAGRAPMQPAYPMPFHQQVRFQLPAGAAQSVFITDGLGRLVATVRSQPNGSVQWQPAPEVAPGLYFARPADNSAVFRLLRQ